MKIFCTNTTRGLVPNYDSDFEEKKKLKVGEVYQCEIRLARNYEFLKKYFALINCAWEYQGEKVRTFFGENVETFRKAVEVQAGHYELCYSISRKEWLQVPKSISFEKMSEDEFSNLYNRVKDVLYAIFLRNITAEEFEKNLINF